MNKGTRNLILFFLATFVATWATYFTIVFNGWDPYTMPGMVVILALGLAFCILVERKISQVAVAQPEV